MANQLKAAAKSRASEALHHLKYPDNEFVSASSRWKDPRWRLTDRNEGNLNWELMLPDGSTLLDKRHRLLLQSTKRLIWSLMHEPIDRDALPPSSAANILSASRPILLWMIKTRRNSFSELTVGAFEEFMDDWISAALQTPRFDESGAGGDVALDEEDIDDENDDESELSFTSLYNTLKVWKAIWTQGPALVRSGTPTMPEDPLQNRSVLSVTNETVAFVVRVTPPLPDEVALPIMNEAHRWLGVRADDVIRLHVQCMTAIKVLGEGNPNATFTRKKHADVFPTFHFSVEQGATEPWHRPLSIIRVPKQRKNRVVYYYCLPAEEVRRLVDALYGACLITVNSESGVRPGELRTVVSGTEKSGEPESIEKRLSKSGLIELFYVLGKRKKGLKNPVPDEWLLGARPVGSTYVPNPVRAIEVLELLFAPWRELCPDSEAGQLLCVGKRSGGSLPVKGSSVFRPSNFKLLNTQRKFIEDFVDLSDIPDRSTLNENLVPYRETKGHCIIATQWRKTYAMYVVRTDRRMIPAIATQFHHLHVAMTELAYIGNNPQILRETKSQQSRAAAGFMYRFIVGGEPAAGRVAKLIEEFRPTILSIVGDGANPSGLSNLHMWCEDRGIRAFDSPHGICFIALSPCQAECQLAAGTAHWSNTAPNFERREPSLCASCSVFGVDTDHSDFWVNRYIENSTAWLQAKKRGLSKGFRVMQERASTAANMLRVLRIPLPNLGDLEDD
jgi:hypothetical protein